MVASTGTTTSTLIVTVTFQIVSDQHPSALIPLVDVAPPQAVQSPILTKILIDSAASTEVHTTVLLPRPPP